MFVRSKLSAFTGLAISLIALTSMVNAAIFPSAVPVNSVSGIPHQAGDSVSTNSNDPNQVAGNPNLTPSAQSDDSGSQPDSLSDPTNNKPNSCPGPNPGIPADCARDYTIQGRDTCNGISSANNVSSYQLLLVNKNIINPDCANLTPGMLICLGRTNQDCKTTYQVQFGDDCEGIAGKAVPSPIDVNTLLQNNPNVNAQCSNLQSEEVLCTQSTVVPYTS